MLSLAIRRTSPLLGHLGRSYSSVAAEEAVVGIGTTLEEGKQRYGVQGTAHMIPFKGYAAEKKPIKVKLEKDKKYFWCACGYAMIQPFCDNTHTMQGYTMLRPVPYIPEKDMEVWLCTCKQTNNRPFCDGSHKKLPRVVDKEYHAAALKSFEESPVYDGVARKLGLKPHVRGKLLRE